MNTPGFGRHPFVFHDPAGKRWPRLRRLGLALGALLFVVLICFIQSLMVTPDLRLPESVRKMKSQLRAHPAHPATSEEESDSTAPPTEQPLSAAAPDLHRKSPGVRAGFFADWDPYSISSLEANASLLTHLCYDWASLSDAAGTLSITPSPQAQELATRHGLILVPTLTNRAPRRWQPEWVENLANGPAAVRQSFITNLVAQLQKAGAGGLLLHFEEVDPAYQDATSRLIEEIAYALHGADKKLWFTVTMGNAITTFDLKRLMPTVDRFVATLTNERSEDDAPGPLITQAWFKQCLSTIEEYGYPKKWIITLGTQGCDWTTGKPTGEVISFPNAMSRANYAGLDTLTTAAPTYSALFSYVEPGGEHTVSFLDAISFFNQYRAVRQSNLGGIAIDRLGTEDPGIWDVLSLTNLNAPDAATLEKLTYLDSTETITHIGKGEMVTVDDARTPGRRRILGKKSGLLGVTYLTFPSFPAIFHEGAADPGAVSITFDDGPDPVWTPKILDILKKRGVTATFFIVGSNAEKSPELVRRIIDEGHIIGNHSYSHAHFGEITQQQIHLELNATQRLLEHITGRSTILVRPPYNADAHPSSLAELIPLKIVQDALGYLIILESIDPKDWDRPGVDTILQRIKEQREDGNIILLHDAGGNRRQTVEALPAILDYLEARGDRVVSLSDLLHISKEDLMPPVEPTQRWVRLISFTGFSIWHKIEQSLWALMMVSTLIVIVRSIIISLLAWRNQRSACRLQPALPTLFHPPASILIAAYNEEKVIEATLRSVLHSTYPGTLQVIVVDDGSKDQTSAKVAAMAAAYPDRIQLITQPNQGKATALSTAMAAAKHEIFIFVDADTHFEPQSILHLVQPLADEAVGAVSGQAKVGNLGTFLTRCQALEYACGFNLDRRAYAEWNCITVAPGAISAVRRSALERIGGFSRDTLAEDTDLTLSLHKHGYRIAYAHEAVAWTEAPETFTTLSRQRFRWAFGTLQCLWKHRDLTFNTSYRALGWFALPSVWFCQIFLVAITPIIDVMLILSVIGGYVSESSLFLAAFLGMDLLLAIIACALDGQPLRKAWMIIPMRLIYRPLLSWTIWRSILKATKGAWVTWGKLERTATVQTLASTPK